MCFQKTALHHCEQLFLSAKGNDVLLITYDDFFKLKLCLRTHGDEHEVSSSFMKKMVIIAQQSNYS